MSRHDVEAEITMEESELVPGGRATLRFRITAHAPVKLRGAHVHFRGFEETKAVYTTSDGKTTTTHTAVEKHVLVEGRETILGKPPAGFFSNLADGAMTLLGGGDHEILEPGRHEATLRVELPGELPPTFAAKKIRIAYEAGVHLDLPAARDFQHTESFAVAPVDTEIPVAVPLSLRYPEDAKRGFFDSLFGPEVQMRVDLESTVVRRGEELIGELQVHSKEKPLSVEAVECTLLRRETSEAQKHKDKHAHKLVVERIPQQHPRSTRLSVPFTVTVPESAIPARNGAKFTLAHELAVSLDVPWAKDPTIRIPIRVV